MKVEGNSGKAFLFVHSFVQHVLCQRVFFQSQTRTVDMCACMLSNVVAFKAWIVFDHLPDLNRLALNHY